MIRDLAELDRFNDMQRRALQAEAANVGLQARLDKPLRESIFAVLQAFEGTGIAPEHLAAQIESQVQAWQAIPPE